MTIAAYRDLWPQGAFPCLDAWLRERPHTSCFTGLAGSADAWLVADLFRAARTTVLVCVDNPRRAETLADECRTFLADEEVLLFPSRDAVPYNLKSPFGPTVETRLALLAHLLAGRRAVVIAPHAALLQAVPPARELFNATVRLTAGMTLSIEQLCAWLQDIGFRRENSVENVGTFAVRGGIVDVYPYASEHPLRAEFFGDTLESLRSFSVFSQKSMGTCASAEVLPLREFCLRSDVLAAGVEKLAAYARAGHADEAAVRALEHQWLRTGDHEGIEWFLHWFKTARTSLMDYLPEDAVVVWDDLLPATRRFQEIQENYRRHMERVAPSLQPLVSPPEQLLLAPTAVGEELGLFASVFVETKLDSKDVPRYACDLHPQPPCGGNIETFIADCRTLAETGISLTVLSPTLGHAERLAELIGPRCPAASISVGSLREGYVDRAGLRAVYSDQQLFGREVRQPRMKKFAGGAPVTRYEDLVPGDHVVHVDHGIGRFGGVERVRVGAAEQDCMVLHYQDNARLYVPVEDFHRVQKYVGGEAAAPQLSTLGSGAWERVKQRTRASLRDMAQDLIELYAKRQYLEGVACAPDTVWQREFEEAFLYEETPDQHRAIAEVKADMEAKKPMDRLVCGDVGFGKTEVAMRAAFKAAMSGYQVAVLAPTTVLAAQHYETFRERMASFPVRVAMLSRFLKPREQKDVLVRLAEGTADIVIGTHRLLSKDCAFKNLGLLVIDEEQRFGVRHKERLKQMRFEVDVLSMTATPIPRTLHMSLIGARDLSIIATPPRNRLPIQTSVAEYHEELLTRAIQDELSRGGQVYVVDNRIKNLYRLQTRIEELVPQARVSVAHGQMDEGDLERVMKEFVAGRCDVLVATTIIENGLDISNVNTIIIDHADTLGLSQLYQLRGRVGRSAEQAYAWLLTPPFKAISEISLRRLRVLEQYTDLGSGFQIAMRDLEIRGAGDVLGTMQHGAIVAVGFELYCRLLKEAIDEIQGRSAVEEELAVKVDVEVDAYIPTEYVADAPTRVAIYRELSDARTPAAVAQVRAMLTDRFGPFPPSVEALMLLMDLKLAARAAGVSRASLSKDGVLTLAVQGTEEQVRVALKGVLASPAHHFEVMYETPLRLRAPLGSVSPLDRVREAVSTLRGSAS